LNGFNVTVKSNLIQEHLLQSDWKRCSLILHATFTVYVWSHSIHIEMCEKNGRNVFA